MKKIFLCCALATAFFGHAQSSYKVASTYHIASPGGWDYITVYDGRIFVSHGTQVNVLSETSGDSVGVIANTQGVHGITFNKALNRGYTSNGRANNVSVFDAKTLQPISQITTGENPDAIMFEPYTQTIITCNGRSKNLSIIDAKTSAVVATVDVGGKPETAVSNEAGMLYVNIEDKNEIAVVDLKSHAVTKHWSLNGAEGPTGLAYDKAGKRLFAGCDKTLVVMNAETGSIVDKIKIGDGCDGVAYDAKSKNIYTSNGEGTLSVIKQLSADKYNLISNVPTKRGARTIAIDENNGTVFLPTADFEPAQQGQRPRMIPGTFQILVVKQ